MMAFELPNALQQNRNGGGPAWSGAAFIVEAMLLLAFLIGSLAIFTQMYALSTKDAYDSERLSQAVAVATQRAEEFASDPLRADGSAVEDDLRVDCVVTREEHDRGTLYRAEISVYDASSSVGAAAGEAGAAAGAGASGGADEAGEADEALYTITTARYFSESEVTR